MENYREKLVSRVTRYFEGVDEDAENRLISEISSYADKVCIDEEMQRLGAHIDNFEYNMEQPGAIGSQLNYYTQEMNREANTMGSKANDLGITNLVIAMKSEIEKLREQVQNIE